MHYKRGFILLYVLFFMAVACITLGILVRLIYVNFYMAGDEAFRLKAFYAAEAGIEWAKSKMSSNPDWFTDLPHSPPDDTAWLLKSAVGFEISLGDARFKMVREDGKNRLYSIGYTGTNIERSRAVSIVKVEFTILPFEQVSWTNL